MYADHLRYNLLVDLIIMLLLLMMQLEKLKFIALDINMLCLLLFLSRKIWLRMRQKKRLKCLRSDNGGENFNKYFDS